MLAPSTIAPRWTFTTIACLLSSVTAVSVALAMFALIEDPVLALLFAAAAVLLDVYKYLAWPLALASLSARRFAAAGLLMLTAVALAGVSGWATYDRLMGSIIGSRMQNEAIQSQRIADLEAARTADRQLIASLDAEVSSTRAQAEAMRLRGMVSKAQDMEAVVLPRIADQRDKARERLDQASLELTELRAKPSKVSVLPLELAVMLCAGFALALEIVPALLLSVVRRFPAPAVASPARAPVAGECAPEAAIENVPVSLETRETGPETQPDTPETEEPTVSQAPVIQAEDAALLQKLLALSAETPRGQRVKLREFAKAHRIGNLRAASIFQVAADVGALQKTATGYAAA